MFAGKLYIGSDDENLYCLNSTNGEKIWKKSLPGGTGPAGPTIYDGKVYQGSTYDYFYCRNADNGSLIWKYYKDYGSMSSATVTNDKVYVGMRFGYFFCLNANNGSEIWKKRFSDKDVVTCPAVVKGKVYTGSQDHNLYCMDADNGSILWYFDAGDTVFSSPAVVDGKLYFGGDGLYCLDAESGEEFWNYSGDTVCSPAIAYGKVYYHRDDGVMTCLNAENGSFIWENPIGASFEITTSSPVVADGKVYIKVWSTGNLFCLDADNGEILWVYEDAGTPYWTWSSPIVVNGTLYVGGDMTNLVWAFWTPPGGPPEPPEIYGMHIGAPGTYYTYSFMTNDPEGDDVYYWIDWGDDSPMDWIGPYESGENMTRTHKWLTPGEYKIKAKAKDTYGWESNWSDPFNLCIVNNIPNNPEPKDGATDVEINATLSWNCTDPEGDDLTYDVYFEADDLSPDELVSNNQSENWYDPGTMEYGTHYFWQIIAWKIDGEFISGPVWDFTTEIVIPDLECDGIIEWIDVKPGEIVTDSFTIENIGDSQSLLYWEVSNYPSWGDWTFSPSSGDDLKPEDGQITINVSVITPDEQYSEFNGRIRIVNQENSGDCCKIDVSLSTPRNKAFNFNFNRISWLFERFTLLQRLLSLPIFERMYSR